MQPNELAVVRDSQMMAAFTNSELRHKVLGELVKLTRIEMGKAKRLAKRLERNLASQGKLIKYATLLAFHSCQFQCGHWS
jgi:flagellar motor switch protein FliG